MNGIRALVLRSTWVTGKAFFWRRRSQDIQRTYGWNSSPKFRRDLEIWWTLLNYCRSKLWILVVLGYHPISTSFLDFDFLGPMIMWNSTNFVTPNWVDSVHFTSFQMLHFFGRERWWHVRMNPWSVFFNTWDTTQGVAWENYGKLMNMISNILKVFRQIHLKISPRWQRSRWTSEVGSIMAQAFQKVFAEMDAENPSGVTLEWLGAGKFLSYQEIANFHAALFLPEQPDKLTWPGGSAQLGTNTWALGMSTCLRECHGASCFL